MSLPREFVDAIHANIAADNSNIFNDPVMLTTRLRYTASNILDKQSFYLVHLITLSPRSIGN